MLQTGIAASKTQLVIRVYAKNCQKNAISVTWEIEQVDSGTEIDIRISPETLPWLVRAQWDAAEYERSDYLMSPSHRSELGHPKI